MQVIAMKSRFCAYLITALAVGLVVCPAAVASESAKTVDNSTKPFLDISSTASYVAEPSAQASEKQISFKTLVHKSLFMNDLEAQKFEQAWSSTLAKNRLGIGIGGMTSPDTASEEGSDRAARLELVAREETYQFMSRLFFSLKPMAIVKEALEPLSRPLEVHKNRNGSMETGFFVGPNRPVGDGSGERMLGFRLWVSPSHNINAMVDVGSNLKISFLDGGVVDARLISGDGTRFFGVQRVGPESAMLVLGFGF